MDEQAPEIRIAALADPEQFRLPSCGMLARHQTQPGRKVAPFDECRPVSNGRHHRCGHQRAHAGDLVQSLTCRVLLSDPLNAG